MSAYSMDLREGDCRRRRVTSAMMGAPRWRLIRQTVAPVVEERILIMLPVPTGPLLGITPLG
jgi:hypothetical protein